jgi:hypothetical protein
MNALKLFQKRQKPFSSYVDTSLQAKTLPRIILRIVELKSKQDSAKKCYMIDRRTFYDYFLMNYCLKGVCDLKVNTEGKNL